MGVTGWRGDGDRAGRKGYIHALEGIIAAVIVVVYLTSIVSVPDTTTWKTTRISKQSEDILSALDGSGFLDRTVLRGDTDSFNAMVSALHGSISYSVKVRGLPKQRVDIGVLVHNSSTYRIDTAPGDWGGTGLPDSEGDRYRQGDLAAHAEFGTVRFVLSDTVDNGILDFSSVNLDLNGNGDFGDAGEGPFNFSDRFACTAGEQNCADAADVYEPAPFNTSLVLYNASIADRLHAKQAEMDIGRRRVTLSYGMANVFDESVETFDALWMADWSVGEIAARDALLQDFLQEGRTVLIHSTVSKPAIDNNYLSTLGFDFIGEYRLTAGTGSQNIFFSLHGPKNESYRTSQYYLDGGIRQDDFTDAGGFDEATVTIRGSDVTVRRWPDDSVSFSSGSFAVNHSRGDPVSIEGNSYVVASVHPLVLNPRGQQRFDSFETARIDADYHATKMEGRHYNITQYDTSAEFDDRFQNRTDLPRRYEDGAVNTPCDWRNHPYNLGDITVDGTTYRFLMVNFEPAVPCDSYFEFIYFDLNQDDDMDDESLPHSSREGPYQDGDVVNISGNRYAVSLHIDGNGTDLKRRGPRLVGEVPVARNPFGRGGSTVLVRRQALGHDDVHLLTSLLVRETQEQQSFTAPKSLGDTSLGYTYSSSAGQQNSFGYTLQTVWWLP